MSEPTNSNPRPAAQPAAPPTRSNRWLWVIPAATFLVGLLLGATLVAVTTNSRNGADGRQAVTATGPRTPGEAPAASASADRVVVIPASCEQGLERARTALATVGDAIDALRGLDTGRLQQLLDQLQTARTEVDTLTQQCRAEAERRN